MHTKIRESVLRYYAALESASQEMLDAARAGDWDNVCRLEGACAVVIATLRKEAIEHPLRQDEQGDRMRILKSILANDAEIRRICEPWPMAIDGLAFNVREAGSAVH